jgi:hypothetical protein
VHGWDEHEKRSTAPSEKRQQRRAQQLPEDAEAGAHVGSIAQFGKTLRREHAAEEDGEEEERDARQLALDMPGQTTAPGQDPAS